MSFPKHSTNRAAISSSGNTWQRINEVALIVSKRKDGRWWFMSGSDFLLGSFTSNETAKRTCLKGNFSFQILKNFGVVPYSASTIWLKCRTVEFPSTINASAAITAWRFGDIRKYLGSITKPTNGAAV
jgi:hypothetical protein